MQNVVHRPGSLLEMQTARSHPRPIKLEFVLQETQMHIIVWEALLWGRIHSINGTIDTD